MKKKLPLSQPQAQPTKTKLRSKLPLRRRRTHLSPIICSYPALVVIGSASATTFEQSGDSSRVTAVGNAVQKPEPSLRKGKKVVVVDEFRRVTRSRYLKSQKQLQKQIDDDAEISKGDGESGVVQVSASEATSCVESCSFVGEVGESDALNRSGLNLFAAEEDVEQSDLLPGDFDVTSGQAFVLSPAISSRKLDRSSPSPVRSVYNDLDLFTSEEFVDDSESSFFSPSMFIDSSGSDFSERSGGDSSHPSLVYSLFLEYRQAFLSSTTPLAAQQVAPDGYETYMRFDDELDEECYQCLRSRERRQVYIRDYTEECHSLVHQRQEIVHWIVQQSSMKKLQMETLFLGVNLLDRFLSMGTFKSKRSLQISGIACLTLATRIEENQINNSVQQKTFRLGSSAFSRLEVVAMEWLVQEVLNFKCFLPTIYNFLSFYLKVAKADREMASKVQQLAERALLQPEQLSYWPSTVAAGLVVLSSFSFNNRYSAHLRIIKTHARSRDDDLNDCVKSLSSSLTNYLELSEESCS